jgi:hypothetical protein
MNNLLGDRTKTISQFFLSTFIDKTKELESRILNSV